MAFSMVLLSTSWRVAIAEMRLEHRQNRVTVCKLTLMLRYNLGTSK